MIVSFENMVQRLRQPHILLIGELKPYYFTSFEKDLDFNIT
jgi:cytochrome P450